MIATSLQTRKKLYMAPEVTRAGPCGPGDVKEKRTRAASSTEDFLVGRWSFVFCLLVRAKHQKTCWKLCVCRQSMSFLNWESWSCKLAFMFQFSSVQLLSHVRLLATPWIAACQASLSITNSWSLLKLMPIESVMPSSHFILCCPLLLLPPIPPSIRVFSNESTLCIRYPKYWSFSFSISPSNEHPGLISFRVDWLDLLAVQGTLKSLLQQHSSKASIFWLSAFFTVQLSHPYMTTGKTTALTRHTFVGKVMSLVLICYLGWS